MRILYLADARSPIARNWINYFIERGDDVHVISSHPCDETSLPGAHIYPVPIAFSGLMREQPAMAKFNHQKKGPLASLTSSFLGRLRLGPAAQMIMNARYRLSAVDLPRHVQSVRRVIDAVQPELVHAMRLPFEGMLAAMAVRKPPLLLSVWGNDFTLFARRYQRIGRMTRQALRKSTALHCDCVRDVRLAQEWGFDKSKPVRVLPGSGGIKPEIFYCEPPREYQYPEISPGVPVIVNPRGFRAYVHNDTFFKAIPAVLEKFPSAVFIGVALKDNLVAEKLIAMLGISSTVRLLPALSQAELAGLFRRADIAVSPTSHDGTPNTLLECMACGCFPIAGNIESLREWITDGKNGFLFDPTDHRALAAKIVQALENRSLRDFAAAENRELIEQRADYLKVMATCVEFYNELISVQGE